MLEKILNLNIGKISKTNRAPAQLIAITSPYGSTGKSCLSLAIATLLDAEKSKVLLIDADTFGASLANQLALAELPAGFAGALRIASQDRLDISQLERLSVMVPKTNLRLLPGSANLSKVAIETTNLSTILDVAREHFDYVIADCGSFSNSGIATELISLADRVVLVALADPVGVFRVLGIENQVLELVNQPLLLVNRLRNSTINQAKKEISETLSRLGHIEIAGYLPDDPAQLDQAIRLGVPVPLCSRSGPFSQAVSAFVRHELLGKPGLLDGRMAKLG
jgi:MinD-like ATPase involved in chromosome partitioning or flagellar assembly